MTANEKLIALSLKSALQRLPADKKEYLLGVADGMAAMVDRRSGGGDTYAENQDPAG